MEEKLLTRRHMLHCASIDFMHDDVPDQMDDTLHVKYKACLPQDMFDFVTRHMQLDADVVRSLLAPYVG